MAQFAGKDAKEVQVLADVQDALNKVEQFEDMETLQGKPYSIEDYKTNLHWVKHDLEKILNEHK